VLFTCEEERRLAQGSFLGPGYIERVVAFGTPDAPPGAVVQRSAFRQALPGLGDRPYLLFLGRMHPKKGGNLLVEAFAGLADLYPNVDLVMAGPDDMGLEASLQSFVAAHDLLQRIHWPGLLGGDVKWGALREATAFVLPSHQENFGIAVAEAMACGIPVAISNKVNIWREILAGGGGIVGEDTTEATLTSLKTILDMSQPARIAMGEAARRTYESHFTIDAAGESLMAVLDGAVGAHRQRVTA
jgi:glycosyltransferase involved in cell wall biosynthesis